MLHNVVWRRETPKTGDRCVEEGDAQDRRSMCGGGRRPRQEIKVWRRETPKTGDRGVEEGDAQDRRSRCGGGRRPRQEIEDNLV